MLFKINKMTYGFPYANVKIIGAPHVTHQKFNVEKIIVSLNYIQSSQF